MLITYSLIIFAYLKISFLKTKNLTLSLLPQSMVMLTNSELR